MDPFGQSTHYVKQGAFADNIVTYKEGGVGVAADRRMSKFSCRRTQIFVKQCQMPQI